MADAGQMLAFETTSLLGPGATVGWCVGDRCCPVCAAPAPGAARFLRLRQKPFDGKGDHLAFGGKVMKNVAGFDVCRLLAGSFWYAWRRDWKSRSSACLDRRRSRRACLSSMPPLRSAR